MPETLPASPSPDVGLKHSQKLGAKVAQFGDGYSQRATFGLNQRISNVTLSYTNITVTEAQALTDFIDDHADGQVFYYTLPQESAQRKWYLTDWDNQYVKYGIRTITMQLTECFDVV